MRWPAFFINKLFNPLTYLDKPNDDEILQFLGAKALYMQNEYEGLKSLLKLMKSLKIKRFTPESDVFVLAVNTLISTAKINDLHDFKGEIAKFALVCGVEYLPKSKKTDDIAYKEQTKAIILNLLQDICILNFLYHIQIKSEKEFYSLIFATFTHDKTQHTILFNIAVESIMSCMYITDIVKDEKNITNILAYPTFRKHVLSYYCSHKLTKPAIMLFGKASFEVQKRIMEECAEYFSIFDIFDINNPKHNAYVIEIFRSEPNFIIHVLERYEKEYNKETEFAVIGHNPEVSDFKSVQILNIIYNYAVHSIVISPSFRQSDGLSLAKCDKLLDEISKICVDSENDQAVNSEMLNLNKILPQNLVNHLRYLHGQSGALRNLDNENVSYDEQHNIAIGLIKHGACPVIYQCIIKQNTIHHGK